MALGCRCQMLVSPIRWWRGMLQTKQGTGSPTSIPSSLMFGQSIYLSASTHIPEKQRQDHLGSFSSADRWNLPPDHLGEQFTSREEKAETLQTLVHSLHQHYSHTSTCLKSSLHIHPQRHGWTIYCITLFSFTKEGNSNSSNTVMWASNRDIVFTEISYTQLGQMHVM